MSWPERAFTAWTRAECVEREASKEEAARVEVEPSQMHERQPEEQREPFRRHPGPRWDIKAEKESVLVVSAHWATSWSMFRLSHSTPRETWMARARLQPQPPQLGPPPPPSPATSQSALREMPRAKESTASASAQAQQDAVADGIDNFELPRSLIMKLARASQASVFRRVARVRPPF